MISPINRWVLAAFVWINVIFFSSTATAARWSKQAFTFLAANWFKSTALHVTSYPIAFIAEKSVHVCLFLVLAILLSKALPKVLRKFRFILLMGLLIGSASEFLQSFFPSRDPALRDVCFNVAGTAIGAAAVLVIRQSMRNRRAVFAPSVSRNDGQLQ